MRRVSFLLAGVLALALIVSPQAAVGQIMGLYYQEVEKDGRVYVFNTPEKYDLWQQTGDMGVAITLIGQGANGETLVAENETAIDLYNFKHNLPAYARPTPKPAAIPFDVSWKDGKTTIKSKSAELNLSNRIQVRYTSEDLDQASSSQPERDSFRVRRMKTKLDGWAYTKDLTYELQINFADSANVLEDANVNYDFTKGQKAFMLKFGQFKVPFGRQELTSSGSQQFVDRSLVENTFARGRDVGIQAWGTPLAGKLDWRVGVFNGNGRTVSRNDNDELQTNARLTWQPFGDVKYSESDFDSTDKPLFALAGQYELNTFEVAAAGSTAAHQDERTTVGADAVFKYKGFSVYGEFFDREHDRNKNLADFDDSGLVVQAGYFVLPKKLELALRWGDFDPHADRDDDNRLETGAAFNYFFNKHNHKLQADFRELENEANNQKDREIRLQYQLIF